MVVNPLPDPDQPFGDNPKAEKKARAALRARRSRARPFTSPASTRFEQDSGSDNGPGVLAEALIGGAGALAVLAFVFASFLAIVPIFMAVASIMTTFLLLWGLPTFTDVSLIVQFLVALIGLGVAIDYSLLIVVRWREERAKGGSDAEAIQRAMETAGRAVVFSGTTVAIGLLALIVLPLPFLRSVGYGGMLIPLVSVARGDHAAARRAGDTIGPRLDWPHKRTDDSAQPRLDALGGARGAAPLDRGGRRGRRARRARWSRPRTSSSATPTPTRSRRRGDAKAGLNALERSGIGAGAMHPHEVLVARRRRDPEQVAADHGAGRRRARRGGARAAPTGGATAPRSSTCSATADAARRAGQRHARPRARRRARAGPACASAAAPR